MVLYLKAGRLGWGEDAWVQTERGTPECELGEGTPGCRPFLSPLVRMAESLWSVG